MTNFTKYMKAAAQLHDGLHLIHKAAHAAGHGDFHQQAADLHKVHAAVCDALAADPQGGSDVPVGHDFKAVSDATFKKIWGIDRNTVLPDNVRGTGLTEEAANMETAPVGKMILRPGMSDAGAAPDTKKLIEQEGDWLSKFV